MLTFLSTSVVESPPRSWGMPPPSFLGGLGLGVVDAFPPPVLPRETADKLIERTLDREEDAIEEERKDMLAAMGKGGPGGREGDAVELSSQAAAENASSPTGPSLPALGRPTFLPNFQEATTSQPSAVESTDAVCLACLRP